MFYYAKPVIRDKKIIFPTVVSQTGNENGNGNGGGLSGEGNEQGLNIGCEDGLFTMPGLAAVTKAPWVRAQVTSSPALSDLNGCVVSADCSLYTDVEYTLPDSDCNVYVGDEAGQFILWLKGATFDDTCDLAIDCTAKGYGTDTAEGCPGPH